MWVYQLAHSCRCYPVHASSSLYPGGCCCTSGRIRTLELKLCKICCQDPDERRRKPGKMDVNACLWSMHGGLWGSKGIIIFGSVSWYQILPYWGPTVKRREETKLHLPVYAFQCFWSSPDISAKNGSIRLQPRTVDLDGALNEARKVVPWQMRSPVSLQLIYSVVHPDTPPLLQFVPEAKFSGDLWDSWQNLSAFFISQVWIFFLTSSHLAQAPPNFQKNDGFSIGCFILPYRLFHLYSHL